MLPLLFSPFLFMNDEELTTIILKNTVQGNGRLELSCERGHQLAAELGVTVARIGEICMQQRIKIVHCQLGCFGGGHK